MMTHHILTWWSSYIYLTPFNLGFNTLSSFFCLWSGKPARESLEKKTTKWENMYTFYQADSVHYSKKTSRCHARTSSRNIYVWEKRAAGGCANVQYIQPDIMQAGKFQINIWQSTMNQKNSYKNQQNLVQLFLSVTQASKKRFQTQQCSCIGTVVPVLAAKSVLRLSCKQGRGDKSEEIQWIIQKH